MQIMSDPLAPKTITGEVNIHITDHAYQRMKERCGWNKKAGARMADLAFNNGIRHQDTKGSLHRFIDKIYLSHQNASKLVLYGQAVFIFGRGNVLVTVYAVPSRLRKMVPSIK